jgi:hypothetical protein
MCLKVLRQLARHDQQSVCQLCYVEIPSLRVAQYITDEVHLVLNLMVAT